MGEKNTFTGLDRRSFVSGLAAGAGLGLASQVSAESKPILQHLKQPVDNLRAFMKLQADVSGSGVLAGSPGEVWAWVPGEGNFRLFTSYGISTTRAEPMASGWRIEHTEALFYTDPESGEIVHEWTNPFTGRRVKVEHLTPPTVNRIYRFEDGELPHEVSEDDLVFTSSVFEFRDSKISRSVNPLQVQHDKHQSGDLRSIKGRLSEVLDPRVDSAQCVISSTRMTQWIPFMEMGNRPGVLVYHSQGCKLRQGIAQLPEHIGQYALNHEPGCLASLTV